MGHRRPQIRFNKKGVNRMRSLRQSSFARFAVVIAIIVGASAIYPLVVPVDRSEMPRSFLIASGQELMDMYDYEVALSVSGAPDVSEVVTATIVVTPTVNVGQTAITVAVPGHYSVEGSSPAYSDYDTGGDKIYVTWLDTMSAGVAETYILSIEPSAETGEYEQFLASAAERYEDAPYGPTFDSAWVLVGDPGAVS